MFLTSYTFTGPSETLLEGQNAQGLPMGVHVLGRYGDEATLIRLASQLERARPWADSLPVVSALAQPLVVDA